MPINIFCFGDSNTAGDVPSLDAINITQRFYDELVTWTGQLQKILGDDYIIEIDALSGRTTIISGNLPADIGKNGLEVFIKVFPKNLPVDFLIVQLQTNDLKKRFHKTPKEIAEDLKLLIQETIRICEEAHEPIPKIIILSPTVDEDYLKYPYNIPNARERCKELVMYNQRLALEYNCILIDLTMLIEPSGTDGIHWEPEAHGIVAGELARVILNFRKKDPNPES